MTQKQCSKCNQLLPESAFPRVRREDPERRATCGTCCSRSFQEWRERQGDGYLERKREYWRRRGRDLRRLRREREGRNEVD